MALTLSTTTAASTLSGGCNDYLDLDDVSKGFGLVSVVSMTNSLCFSIEQFPAVAMGDPTQWLLEREQDQYWVLRPTREGRSMIVLFEPESTTGHAVVISAKPVVTN